MSIARHALLALADSAWLCDRATKSPIVRRSVRRFMPGERLDDALGAASQLASAGVPTILTHLGEHITSGAQAEGVASHYLEVLDRVHAAGLDAHLSIKLTQLGLDVDSDRCERHLRTLVDRAHAREQFVWIDMESSLYVDRTLALFERACERSPRVGVALQAYLHRTDADIARLLPWAPAIRLVKGAYLEPSSIALRRRTDIDANYERLGDRLIAAAASRGLLVHLGTHDEGLARRLLTLAAMRGVLGRTCECAMLYGIAQPMQQRLIRMGAPLRVLIAYGDNWFPWYMRRLAERPANLWWVIRGTRSRQPIG